MTIPFPNSNINNTGTGMPGAAPLGTQMQGNPNPVPPTGVVPPAPLNPVQQLAATQMANGQIPLQVQPTNVNVTPGGDSLLAQLSRGQIIRGDSTYGQGGFMPANAGSSPQAPQSGSQAVQSVTTGAANALTVSAASNYVGN